jgi:hypothetical protein
MKVLNRPMFRYGGPIKEGIMSGIKEPRQRYQDAGQVFRNVGQIITTDTPNPKILNAAAQLGIGNPYRDIRQGALDKKVNLKPINNEIDLATMGGYGEVEKPYLEFDKIPKYIEDIDGDGIRDLNPEYVKNRTNINEIFGGPYKRKTDESFAPPKKSIMDIKQDELASGKITSDVKLPGDDPDPPVELNRKEKVNNILESLGYDRAQKNALYDAMIKAGQRISRTGLGAENLVSDVIAETSQSYDKPEKLREAANLMQTQQDLKLEQIDASKTGGPLKQNYDFYKSQGDSDELAEKKARNLPTTITEKFNASKASTDSGKVYNVTMELTEEGFFGEKYKNKYNGRVGKKYEP